MMSCQVAISSGQKECIYRLCCLCFFRCAKDFRPELRRRLKYIAPGMQSKDLADDSDGGGGGGVPGMPPPGKKPRMMDL